MPTPLLPSSYMKMPVLYTLYSLSLTIYIHLIAIAIREGGGVSRWVPVYIILYIYIYTYLFVYLIYIYTRISCIHDLYVYIYWRLGGESTGKSFRFVCACARRCM